MDETYGTYVDDESFGIHDYHDDTGHDTDDDADDDTDDDINVDTDDDTDDGGRGNRRPLPGGAVHFSSPLVAPRGGGAAYKFLGFGSRLGEGKGEGKRRCSNTPQDPQRGRWSCHYPPSLPFCFLCLPPCFCVRAFELLIYCLGLEWSQL